MRLLLLCTASLLPLSASAQVFLGSATWSGGSAERAHAAALAPDGSLYVVGHTSQGVRGDDIWIGRFTQSLVLSTFVVVNGPGSGADMGMDVAVGADGSVYVVGRTSVTGGVYPWLGKYDADLSLISSYTLLSGLPSSLNGFEAIALAPSGELWVAGQYMTAQPNKGNVWLGRFDGSLNLLAGATYYNTFDFNIAEDIAVDGSDVYVSGSLPPANGSSHNAWVGKFSASTLANQANFTRAGAAGHSDSALQVIASGGDVYISGFLINSGVTNDAFITRLNSSLVQVSSAGFNGSGAANDQILGLAHGYGGRLFIGGFLAQTGQGTDVWAAEYAPSLVLRSSSTFNQSGASADEGRGVAVDTTTGAAFVVGAVTSADQDIWVGRYSALANAPAGSAASNVAAASATISWGLNGNPAGTTAELQRSLDGVAFTSAAVGPIVSYTDVSLLGCTSYWYRARFQNGDGIATAFDSTVNFKTAATTPAVAGSLTAEPAAGSLVALTWTPSPTEGVAGYRLYYDAGDGTVDFGSALAVLTSTETSHVTGVLASSASYKFALRTVHRCGVEEQTGVTAFSGAQAAPAAVRAAIKTPGAGKRVNGNRVTVHAEIVSGTPADTASVRFQYRSSTDTAWIDITAANANHPNPDARSPFFVHWDVTLLTPGSYDLRAVATSVGSAVDPAPAAITIVVDGVSPDISESLDGNGKVKKDQVVSNAVNTMLEAAGGAADDPAVRLTLPAGAVSDSTVTVSVIPNPPLTTAPASGFMAVGSMVSVTLGNGQTQLSNGRTAALTLTYPASVLNPERLQIHWFNDALGRWERDVESTVNTTSRTITCHTPHFSSFGVFSLVSAAASSLGGARVYPNPYRPNAGDPNLGRPFSQADASSGIIFDNLPGNVKLVIYTASGRKVAEFEQRGGNGTVRWDGKNEDGRDAASGVYLAVITSGSEKITRKVAIIR